MGPAVWNGGFSTFLAFVLLVNTDSHIFTTFFKVKKKKTESQILFFRGGGEFLFRLPTNDENRLNCFSSSSAWWCSVCSTAWPTCRWCWAGSGRPRENRATKPTSPPSSIPPSTRRRSVRRRRPRPHPTSRPSSRRSRAPCSWPWIIRPSSAITSRWAVSYAALSASEVYLIQGN